MVKSQMCKIGLWLYLHPLMLLFLTVMIHSQQRIISVSIKLCKGRKSESWIIMKGKVKSISIWILLTRMLIRRRQLIISKGISKKLWQFKFEKPMRCAVTWNCLVPAILGTPFTWMVSEVNLTTIILSCKC